MKKKNSKKSGLRKIIPLLTILTISLIAGFITQKVTARGGGGHGGGRGGGHGWHGGGRGWGGRGWGRGGWGWGGYWGGWGYPYGYYGYGYPYYGGYPYAGITIGLGGSSSSDRDDRVYRDSNGHNFWEITNTTPTTIYVTALDGGERNIAIKNYSTKKVRRGRSFDLEVKNKQDTEVFHCNKHFIKVFTNQQGELDAIDSKDRVR